MSDDEWGWLLEQECTDSQKAKALQVIGGGTMYKIPRSLMTQEQKDMLDDEPTGFICAPWPMKEPSQ